MNMLKRTGEAEILTAESVRGFSQTQGCKEPAGTRSLVQHCKGSVLFKD